MDQPIDAATIRRLRERMGLTQAEFATRLDAHRFTVSKWERGVRRPTGAYAAAIRRLLVIHREHEG